RYFFPVVGLVVLLLAGTLYLWPRVDHPSGLAVDPTATPALNIAAVDGAALYDRMCDKCHGLKEATYGPPLTSLSSITDESLKTLILKGVPESNMPSLTEPLTPEQLAALMKFVKETALPKSPADQQKLVIGPNAAQTQISLALVAVPNSDLIVRATLKDDKGAPLVKAKVTFNKVSALNGRLPLASVNTNEQGVAVTYYPLKPGETLRIEASYEGERGRQASSAIEPVSLAGGVEPEPLATGLSAATPPLGLLGLIALVIGAIWLIYGYVVSLLLRIVSTDTAAPGKEAPRNELSI
ncbi:MAG: c-type cytochrome, partial [Chloroflexi bacterium]|nr:c-type cytochrome [Chloroflexota bacterium]